MNLGFFVPVIKIHYKTLLFKTVKTDTETEAPSASTLLPVPYKHGKLGIR